MSASIFHYLLLLSAFALWKLAASHRLSLALVSPPALVDGTENELYADNHAYRSTVSLPSPTTTSTLDGSSREQVASDAVRRRIDIQRPIDRRSRQRTTISAASSFSSDRRLVRKHTSPSKFSANNRRWMESLSRSLGSRNSRKPMPAVGDAATADLLSVIERKLRQLQAERIAEERAKLRRARQRLQQQQHGRTTDEGRQSIDNGNHSNNNGSNRVNPAAESGSQNVNLNLRLPTPQQTSHRRRHVQTHRHRVEGNNERQNRRLMPTATAEDDVSIVGRRGPVIRRSLLPSFSTVSSALLASVESDERSINEKQSNGDEQNSRSFVR